jgi:hypothetical protein
VELDLGAGLGAGLDRPARIQMIVAVVLGLVLVAIPLYLWRRPRAETDPVVGSAEAKPAVVLSAAEAGVAFAPIDAGAPPAVALSEVRVSECHDPGPKKTSAEQCDRLPQFEKSFAKAIEDAASCVPSSAGGGTIVYVADVSYARKRSPINLTLPREGRTMKNAKVIAACTAAVKKNLASAQLDGGHHQHSRYKFTITATYPGPVK